MVLFDDGTDGSTGSTFCAGPAPQDVPKRRAPSSSPKRSRRRAGKPRTTGPSRYTCSRTSQSAPDRRKLRNAAAGATIKLVRVHKWRPEIAVRMPPGRQGRDRHAAVRTPAYRHGQNQSLAPPHRQQADAIASGQPTHGREQQSGVEERVRLLGLGCQFPPGGQRSVGEGTERRQIDPQRSGRVTVMRCCPSDARPFSGDRFVGQLLAQAPRATRHDRISMAADSRSSAEERPRPGSASEFTPTGNALRRRRRCLYHPLQSQ